MSRMLTAMCLGWFLAASASAAAPAPPLVEPRATKPDSLRALERARADSLRAVTPHRSGGEALAIGLSATLAPAAFALLVNPPDSKNDVAWEASLTIGLALGTFAGPAIGLASGGRGDLAGRGLLLRTVGYSAGLLGVLALASTFEHQVGVGTTVVVFAGIAGVAFSVGSCIYDLAITPGAVGPALRVSLQPVVDERGRLALRATF